MGSKCPTKAEILLNSNNGMIGVNNLTTIYTSSDRLVSQNDIYIDTSKTKTITFRFYNNEGRNMQSLGLYLKNGTQIFKTTNVRHTEGYTDYSVSLRLYGVGNKLSVYINGPAYKWEDNFYWHDDSGLKPYSGSTLTSGLGYWIAFTTYNSGIYIDFEIDFDDWVSKVTYCQLVLTD